MRKKILILFLLILFSCFVSAQEHGVWLHNININILAEGKAEITETFNLYFNTEESKIDFRQKSVEFGSDLRKWEEFDAQFSPTIGSNNIINGKITYSEGQNNYLEIKYGLADSLMVKGKETNFIEEYSIKANYLDKLFQSGLWVIPDNTTITIELPPGAELSETVSPDAIINTVGARKNISWIGYKSANRLNIKYVIWKQINPIIDLNEITNFLFRTRDGLILLGIFIVFLVLIIWKRKFFITKIENFVEENTVFEEY